MAADPLAPQVLVEPEHPSTPTVHRFHHHPLYGKTLHLTRVVHTYLTMLALVLIVFFSVTGFMLNHQEWFDTGDPLQSTAEIVVPQDVLAGGDKLALAEHLRAAYSLSGAVQPFELPASAEDADEPVEVVFKSPRGQAIIEVNLADGKGTLTTETNGLAAVLMNLHKAKDAAPAWRWLLDATAILLFIGAVSGFVLWYSLPKRRLLGLLGMAASLAAVLGAYCLLVR